MYITRDSAAKNAQTHVMTLYKACDSNRISEFQDVPVPTKTLAIICVQNVQVRERDHIISPSFLSFFCCSTTPSSANLKKKKSMLCYVVEYNIVLSALCPFQ